MDTLDVSSHENATVQRRDGLGEKKKELNTDKCHQWEFLLRLPAQNKTEPRRGRKHCQLKRTHADQRTHEHLDRSVRVTVSKPDHTESRDSYHLDHWRSGTKARAHAAGARVPVSGNKKGRQSQERRGDQGDGLFSLEVLRDLIWL